jgi:hypothetical protein
METTFIEEHHEISLHWLINKELKNVQCTLLGVDSLPLNRVNAC